MQTWLYPKWELIHLQLFFFDLGHDKINIVMYSNVIRGVKIKSVSYAADDVKSSNSTPLKSLFPSKVITSQVVTGSLYCCYAPELHWFCIVIGSIVVQDR